MKELEKKVLSANEWGLVSMLHEAYIDNAKEAIECITNSTFDKFNQIFENMRDILSELLIAFKNDNEIGLKLKDVYIYQNKLIADAFRKRDIQIFNDTIKIMNPLYECFSILSKDNDPKIVSGYTYGKNDLLDNKASSTFDIKK